MSKDHAEYLSEEQIAAEVAELAKEIASGKKDEDEIEAMLERMKLAETMNKARHEAGLTQKQLAARMGTNQTYIAALERGRKNISFSTLTRYARACGKKVAIAML